MGNKYNGFLAELKAKYQRGDNSDVWEVVRRFGVGFWLLLPFVVVAVSVLLLLREEPARALVARMQYPTKRLISGCAGRSD